MTLNKVTRMVIAITILTIPHYGKDGVFGKLYVIIRHIDLLIALLNFLSSPCDRCCNTSSPKRASDVCCNDFKQGDSNGNCYFYPWYPSLWDRQSTG
jgi:hypothetical protein